ncbi:MAG: stage II sporulation protein R [Bacilli bacterium]|nr:stage II sporulation protein R [Bacilli bacterium]
MKKLILFILTVAVLILVSNNYEQNYYIIPEESIRIRIIPNSNNIKDQYIKNQVKANIELELQEDLKRVTTIDESRRVIKKNINKYDDVIETVLNNEKYLKKHTIDYGYHYFPEKIYKGVKYSEGEYESLLITLGEAKGDNWWCVLFPPICSLEEDESGQKIEYSFLVKEMFNKYLK